MNQPCTRLIRLSEVMNKTGFGKAWIYRLISQNRFPQPVKIGIRAIAFIESLRHPIRSLPIKPR
ncbi:TPA: helix-turn-helix transcriptional regulator, partial [Salmonella enterica]